MNGDGQKMIIFHMNDRFLFGKVSFLSHKGMILICFTFTSK